MSVKSAEDLYESGMAKVQSCDFEAAIADFSEAIRLKAQYGKAFCGRGHAKLGMGDVQGAISDYTKAIKMNSEDTESLRARGLARASERLHHSGAQL